MSSPIKISPYTHLVRPVSARKTTIENTGDHPWHFFGYPANAAGRILQRNVAICTLCQTPVPEPQVERLRQHLNSQHPVVEADSLSTGTSMASPAPHPNTRGRKRLRSTTVSDETPSDARFVLTLPKYNDDGDDDDNLPDDHDDGHTYKVEYLLPTTPANDQHNDDRTSPAVPLKIERDIEVAADDQHNESLAAGQTRQPVAASADHILNHESLIDRPPASVTTATTATMTTSHQLAHLLATACADDLRPIPDFHGSNAAGGELTGGFAQLLRTLSGCQQMPTVAQIDAELQGMAEAARRSIVADALAAPSYLLIIEDAMGAESLLTLSVLYEQQRGTTKSDAQPAADACSTPTLHQRLFCTWRRAECLLQICGPQLDVLLQSGRCEVLLTNCDLKSEVSFMRLGRKLPIVRCMASTIDKVAHRALLVEKRFELVALENSRNDNKCEPYWLPVMIDKIENRELYEFLQPLHIALQTVESSGEPPRCETAAMVRPLAKQLVEHHYGGRGAGTGGTEHVAAHISDGLRVSLLSNTFLAAASFLDPRFRTLAESNETAPNDNEINVAMLEFIRNMCPDEAKITPQVATTAAAAPAAVSAATTASKPAAGLSFFFGAKCASVAPPPPPLSAIDVELRSYRRHDVDLEMGECPRRWWQQHRARWPLLAACADRLCWVPAAVPRPVQRIVGQLRVPRGDAHLDALLTVHEDRRWRRRQQVDNAKRVS